MLTRPILFRPDLLSLIESGAKTQTRRIIRPQPTIDPTGYFRWTPRSEGHNGIYTPDSLAAECPFGPVGRYLPAARTRLEVTRIRVERVQDISEADALAEGVVVQPDAEIAARVAGDSPARMEFYALWESIYSHGAWAQNAWVWVLDFRLTQDVSQTQT